MLDDVRACRDMGVAGVVIGCLTADGRIDEARMDELVEAARPMKVTCHRAFDMTRDVEEAIEALVRCGVDIVLTSGQSDTALEGIDVLKRTHDAARGRIAIMACGGLDESNIADVLHRSGADELHFKALAVRPSGMRFRNPKLGMGGTAIEREFEVTVTDSSSVRRTIAAARKAMAVAAA
jgi:copper homeostasis protein